MQGRPRVHLKFWMLSKIRSKMTWTGRACFIVVPASRGIEEL